MTGLNAIADGDEDLVGRQVNLNRVTVGRMAQGGGFFLPRWRRARVRAPARPNQATVREGDSVSIQGVIAQMPGGMDDRLKLTDNANDDIYILATSITK